GYPSFIRLQRAAALFRAWGHVPPVIRRLAAHAVRALGRSSVAASKASAMVATNGQLAHLYPVARQVLSKSQRRALLAETCAQPRSRQASAHWCVDVMTTRVPTATRCKPATVSPRTPESLRSPHPAARNATTRPLPSATSSVNYRTSRSPLFLSCPAAGSLKA